MDWKGYGLQQPRGSLPVGPMILMVHIASAWVPFTSESKEAVANYPEILKELRLALQECGRQMQRFLRRRQRVFAGESIGASQDHAVGRDQWQEDAQDLVQLVGEGLHEQLNAGNRCRDNHHEGGQAHRVRDDVAYE